MLIALSSALASACLILLTLYLKTLAKLRQEHLEHKRIASELLRSRDAADAANRAKSTFLANMSHEIRTPLGAVLGFAELLLDTDISDQERAKYAMTIQRNGELLCQLISDVLDLSKVEAERLDLSKAPLKLTELLHDLGELMRLEAANKGLAFAIKAEGELPTDITTDPLRLRQILINVVGNAIKFTVSGQVELVVRHTNSDTKSGQLAFFVHDSGPGIKAADCTRIFEPFTQADESSTRPNAGAGLGLALAKKLAIALGGDVQLERSEPGVGSTFVVTIAAHAT